MTEIRNETEDISTDLAEIKISMREHYEQLCVTKLGNINEMNKFPRKT